jgi:hypothetical protein
MRVALTLGMSLKIGNRNLLSLLAALSLFSVACAGAGDESPQYTGGDAPGVVAGTAAQALQCDSGAVQSCTIFLGQHGDLSNCAHGLDVCTDGAWTGCIDDETLSQDPELFAVLTEKAAR